MYILMIVLTPGPEKMEEKEMKNRARKIIKTAALLTVLGALTAGCATQTGTTTQNYGENYRFVPRIHVENVSFGIGSMQYRGCYYDQAYDGYWCPR